VLWIANSILVTAEPEILIQLARAPEVQSLVANERVAVGPVSDTDSTNAPLEANLSMIGANVLWDMGFSGQGIVIAGVDSGVAYTHPDLAARWRGGSNSWFDPYGQHPDLPVDFHGHGTMTMGVMVGGDAGGTAIGVAPQAQWIAARIYNDQNQATYAAIHQVYQWLLDPDGNPETDDAPDVVNSSWLVTTTGCDLEFQADLQALEAAGILPIFASGNHGPDPNTGRSPANYPEAFSIGSVASTDVVLDFSSRGPADCGSSPRTFPDLTAPGLNIRTTLSDGSYGLLSGTSISAPQVSGGLALLLQAFPGLSAAEQRAALASSAIDLSPGGPDNGSGFGRIDLVAAYNYLDALDEDPGQEPPPENHPDLTPLFLPVTVR
jgi:subtilisin family serine protease